MKVGDKVKIVRPSGLYKSDHLTVGNTGVITRISIFFGEAGAEVKIDNTVRAMTIFNTGWNFPQSALEVVE